MVIINKKRFSENNIKLINGEVVSKSLTKTGSYDISISQIPLSASRFFVQGNIDSIRVNSLDISSFSFKLTGNIDKSLDVNIKFFILNDCVFIFIESKNKHLKLDLVIPTLSDSLSIQTENSDINVASSVKVNQLHIDGKTGVIDTRASFHDSYISSNSGEIFVDITLESETHISVYTKTGNITVHAFDVSSTNLLLHSSANISESIKYTGNYVLSGTIMTQTGNIRLK